MCDRQANAVWEQLHLASLKRLAKLENQLPARDFDMFIIWHRLGILILLVPIVVFVTIQLVVDAALGQGFYIAHLWPKVVGGLLTALAVGAFGYSMNKNEPRPRKHRLFFLPVEYWSAVVAALTVVMAVRAVISR